LGHAGLGERDHPAVGRDRVAGPRLLRLDFAGRELYGDLRSRHVVLLAPQLGRKYSTRVLDSGTQGDSVRTRLAGVWRPIVTPFVDGEIDHAGYERLVEHYVRAGVAGLIPLGTTGESPTIDDAEADALVERTVAAVKGRVPILVGVGGNDTRKVVKAVKRLERHDVQGILSVCPYYNRPSQDGMREHFTRVAEATDRPILIYNIPYRTGVNLTNETLLALARIPNIAGVKDSSGSIAQSLELLRQRPPGFAVLTGEDAYFYTMLAHGGDGGILAS